MFVFPIANSLREGTIYSLVRPKKNANTLDVEKKYFFVLDSINRYYNGHMCFGRKD